MNIGTGYPDIDREIIKNQDRDYIFIKHEELQEYLNKNKQCKNKIIKTPKKLKRKDFSDLQGISFEKKNDFTFTKDGIITFELSKCQTYNLISMLKEHPLIPPKKYKIKSIIFQEPKKKEKVEYIEIPKTKINYDVEIKVGILTGIAVTICMIALIIIHLKNKK